MTANYIAENDKVAEASRILRGETRMMATEAHLQALAQLVREARALLDGDPLQRAQDGVDLRDWLREAAKLD